MIFIKSFRAKIAASVIILIVALQSASSLYSLYRTDQIIVQEIQKEAVNSASSLTSLFQDKTSGFSSLDEKRGFLDAYAGLIGAVKFPALLQEQANLKDVYYVNAQGMRISDASGTPSPVAADLQGLISKKQLGAVEGGGYVTVFVPLVDSQGYLGGFVFSYSDAPISQERQRQVAIAAILILIFSLIGGVAVMVITSAVTKPIRLLVESSQIIAGGNLDRAIDIKGDDELAALAQSFEAMRNSLGAFRRTQEEYSQNLEKTVRERQEYSQYLERTVKERTRELNQKLAEIDRINKVMIGREMKMIELKAELDALKRGASDKSA